MGSDFETHVWLWKVTLVNIRRFKYHCMRWKICVSIWVCMSVANLGLSKECEIIISKVYIWDLVMISVTASLRSFLLLFLEITSFVPILYFYFLFCFNTCNCTFLFVDDDYQGNVYIAISVDITKTINRKSWENVEKCLFLENSKNNKDTF